MSWGPGLLVMGRNANSLTLLKCFVIERDEGRERMIFRRSVPDALSPFIGEGPKRQNLSNKRSDI